MLDACKNTRRISCSERAHTLLPCDAAVGVIPCHLGGPEMVASVQAQVIHAMAEHGNPSSVSDAGVGALCARTAVSGAFLNIKTNAAGLGDKKFVDDMLAKAGAIEKKAISLEQKILGIVNRKISRA